MSRTPINDMLQGYAASGALRLHMPGHKGKTDPRDVTELSFTDDLRRASGVIGRSQALYAATFGAECCHYLVNGATGGLFALALCVKRRALVEKGCHVSLRNALEIAGKEVVFVDGGMENGLPLPPTAQAIAEAVERDERIDAVFVTAPNYVGKNADLPTTYRFLQKKGVAFFVDAAHGAHFGLSPLLPPNAAAFCDAAVQSCHKTLGAPTQTAVLLCKRRFSATIKENLNRVTTTSPSFVLLAGIESALDFAVRHAQRAYEQLFAAVREFRREAEKLGFSAAATDDFTRLVLDCREKGGGKKVYAALEKQNVFCECAFDGHVVAILTLYDDKTALDRLLFALKNLDLSADGGAFDYVDRCFGGADGAAEDTEKK